MSAIDADICIIGAGSGGLSVAAGAVQMGARTVLIEKAEMGGDCLNWGCVPSKSLIAAAHAARAIREAGRFGVNGHAPEVDFAAVKAHVHDVIAAIAPGDSQERFEGLGCTVIRAPAAFTGPGEVAAGKARIRARRFVVATGSGPAVPPIPGLDEVPYLTNESVFDLDVGPEHLLVIGGGPIAVELAQAHRFLGARVTILEMAQILGNDDPELVAVVRRRLVADGIDVREGVGVRAVERAGNGVRVRLGEAGETVEGSHLLVATGRRPAVDGLGLDRAGIAYGPKGIETDARLRTTNRHVYAVGDVAGRHQFTHVASHHAGVVLKNALFRLPAKVENRAVPWATYCHPEIAHVGLAEAAARARHGAVRVLRWPFAENDLARTERETEGLVKVVTSRRGRVLGASIVGAGAGELIAPWVMAVKERLPIKRMADLILPYPTLSEASKRAAGTFYTEALFGPRTRRLVRFLLALPW